MKLTYKHTLRSCYMGYITQAIVNNFPPLLFLTFHKSFGISLERIGLLISINFLVQLIVDLLAVKFVDKIGYRVCAVTAHIMCVVGLCSLAVFPHIMMPYIGLILATVINAIGGGLIEVLISPIVESLPGDEKSSAMSLLHSFYCWGQVGVVLLSTLFFVTVGITHWYLLSIFWAVIPLVTSFLFVKVPLRPQIAETEKTPLKKLFTAKVFWLLFILMVCAGASEQSMSQWASLFAEAGLQVSKTMGDLLGPCAFAILMGTSRLLYGIFGSKIRLERTLFFSGLLCVGSYLLTVFSPFPILSLVGCALCGFSVGIMWPGVFSLSASTYSTGGTGMFAILALAGDLGCAAGPSIVGTVSSIVENAKLLLFNSTDTTVSGLKLGLLAAIVFPVILIIGIFLLNRSLQEKKSLEAK